MNNISFVPDWLLNWHFAHQIKERDCINLRETDYVMSNDLLVKLESSLWGGSLWARRFQNPSTQTQERMDSPTIIQHLNYETIPTQQ